MEEGIPDQDLGACYIEHSVDEELDEHTFYYYIRECSTKANLPHGRGIVIDDFRFIRICYWQHGDEVDTGKTITIDLDGDLRLGETFRDFDGRLLYKGLRYHPKGTIEQF